MRILCAAALLLCLSVQTAASQHDMRQLIDSLQRKLKEPMPDTTRGRVLSFLSQAYSGLDSTKSFGYAQQALTIQRKAGYARGVALALHSLAGAYADDGNLAESEKNYRQALKLIKNDTTASGTQIRIRATANLAFVVGQKGFPQQELDLLLSMVPDIERMRDSSAMAVVYHNIGAKFLNLEEYPKAYPYLLRSSEMLKRTRLVESLGFNYLNIAHCLQNMDSLPQMKRYLDLAKASFEKMPDSDEWSHYYTYYGEYLLAMKKYPEAIRSYREAEQLAQRKKQWYRMDNIWLGLHQVYFATKDYARSREVLTAYYQSAVQRQVAPNRLKALKDLATVEEKSGNYGQAYHYLNQYQQLSDSLREDEVEVQLNDLEKKFQTAQKQKQILQLQNTTKQQQLDLQQSQFVTYFLLAGIVALLILLTLAYLLYRNTRRVAQQKELLHGQKLKELEQEKQLATYSAMLEGQEQERKRIARDLHDGLGGMLAGVKLRLSDLAGKTQPPLPDMELYKVINQLDHSVHELRRIARNMMPETLLQFGLEAALKDLCDSIQNDQTKVVFQPYNLSKAIAQADQIMVYRIVQELVANAVKYAEARQVLVQCIQENSTLHITVEDDGSGFDTTKPSKGMGIANVRNRVEHLKGSLDISSQTNVGTTINAEVHVHES